MSEHIIEILQWIVIILLVVYTLQLGNNQIEGFKLLNKVIGIIVNNDRRRDGTDSEK